MEQKRKRPVRKEKLATDVQSTQHPDATGELLVRNLTLAEEQQILHARARALAREPRRAGEAGQIEVLEFLLACETYGIEMSWVRETLPLKDLTPVPCTPPFVLGLISVRGQIMSVIDIRKFFELPEKGLTDLNKVIIIHDEAMEFGILADVVLGVRMVPLAGLQPSLPTLTGVREEYLQGVTNERLVVLDGKKLLNDRRLVVHEEIKE
ncbi:MAG TPA: chemotaxis protein CheW [Geobacteraceae bacterium]|nr:chemotaxis protein CheW [Geobacteraceae bacterium]